MARMIKTTVDGRTCALYEFDSFDEFVSDSKSFVANRDYNKYKLEDAITDHAKRTDSAKKLQWYGLNGVDGTVGEAIDKIFGEEGWRYGVEKMMEAFGKLSLEAVPESIRRAVVRGDYGDEYDIHTANCGQFDRAWSTRKRKAKRFGSSVKTIAVHGSFNSDRNSSELFWRGAAALRLADMMTDAGYSVEVVLVFNGSRISGSLKHQALIKVKRSDEQAELGTLAASICCAATFRWFGFMNIIKAADDTDQDVSSGLGQSDYSMPKWLPDDTIAVDGNVTNQWLATEWLTKQIKKLEGAE